MSATKDIFDCIEKAAQCPPGSVVVLTLWEDATSDEVEAMRDLITKVLADRMDSGEIGFCLVPHGMTVETLDEEGMAAVGWYRDPETL